MRTANVDLYRFDELSEDIQEKVLNNLYDINVQFDDWYDCAFEQYSEELLKMGYDDVKISFSGFWSQGDGASFTADVDIREISKRALTKDEYEFLWNYCDYVYCSDGVYRTDHRYYHPRTVECGTVEFEANMKLSYALDSDNDRVSSVAQDIEYKLESLCEDIRRFITYEVHGFSRRIYLGLEKEYEYLTSKEAILETVAANEYEFTIDGELAKRFYYGGE